MTTEKLALVLTLIRPGPLQEGLRALLRTIPAVGAIGEILDMTVITEISAAHHPVLLVLDTTLFDGGSGRLIRRLKQETPRTRCLVLAGDVRQQQDSQSAGADAVLLEGAPAASLAAAIEALLVEQEPQVYEGREAAP
jgi:DNA-binding NarL/FixJ family response regulator